MDAVDKKILVILQQDTGQPVADIARKVGLSVTPCWRRIQRLEEEGIIRRRVALLDAKLVDLGMSVFVAIKITEHSSEWLSYYPKKISEYEEVVEFYRMSGDVDYMLRVVVKNIAAYDTFYKKLISDIPIKDVSSSFAMEEIKYTTALPIEQT